MASRGLPYQTLISSIDGWLDRNQTPFGMFTSFAQSKNASPFKHFVSMYNTGLFDFFIFQSNLEEMIDHTNGPFDCMSPGAAFAVHPCCGIRGLTQTSQLAWPVCSGCALAGGFSVENSSGGQRWGCRLYSGPGPLPPQLDPTPLTVSAKVSLETWPALAVRGEPGPHISPV